jgi:hypothetical protein
MLSSAVFDEVFLFPLIARLRYLFNCGSLLELIQSKGACPPNSLLHSILVKFPVPIDHPSLMLFNGASETEKRTTAISALAAYFERPSFHETERSQAQHREKC